jgi:ubiquinone/menaquinone biosynthesis C-methylase UbiE
MSSYLTNTGQAAAAFNKQAALFDSLYGSDSMILYKRKRVRDHLKGFLDFPASILELNAGTGEDTLYLAAQGHSVHATDIAPRMLSILEEKAQHSSYAQQINHELCSFTDLANLQNKGPYDYIFSNFAGLNCTDKLDQVLQQLPSLLEKGGVVTLVIMPKFCLWEFLLLFRGRFKTAFRRFSGKKGASAHMEGLYFNCWYYNPSFIIQTLGKEFELLQLEGLCILVPPSYVEGFTEKHPWIFSLLAKMENRLRSSWPWRCIGDYYIISLRKK